MKDEEKPGWRMRFSAPGSWYDVLMVSAYLTGSTLKLSSRTSGILEEIARFAIGMTAFGYFLRSVGKVTSNEYSFHCVSIAQSLRSRLIGGWLPESR